MPKPDEALFGFQKLDVYRCAIQFVAVAASVIDGFPTGQHSLADQLRRAALSIPVNVAEAVGRSSEGDRRRHFAIARGSAMECAAILDVCGVLGLTTASHLGEGRGLLIRVVRMLSRMCRS
jgi:four helix bundle protein